jgi:hypothetical protein
VIPADAFLLAGAPAAADLPREANRLEGRVAPVAAIPRLTRDAMFALLASHFTGVDRRTFDADLAEKTCAILLEDESCVLRGFSTLQIYDSRVPGPPKTIVYSGDTIVECAWWGSPALPRTWVRAVRSLAAMAVGRDLYWLLLTSGYRTYRFLPVFFRRFLPRHDEDMPAADRRLLDALAAERFGGLYDAATGTVRFPRPQVLAPELLDVPEGRRLDPHIAFFLARNPGYVRGDELVCLTRIDDDNLTAAGRRMSRNAEGTT